MIILTAAVLGIAAGQLRSAVGIALVAALIGFFFAIAAISSPGPVSILALLSAIAGYNVGLVLDLGGLYAIHRLRAAWVSPKA
ncbi:hypothetical protein [Rhizobium binxianense]